MDSVLLSKISGIGKPIIMSTGMTSLAEIDEAARTIWEARGKELATLKCTSTYPALPEELNLLTIPNLAQVENL